MYQSPVTGGGPAEVGPAVTGPAADVGSTGPVGPPVVGPGGSPAVVAEIKIITNHTCKRRFSRRTISLKHFSYFKRMYMAKNYTLLNRRDVSNNVFVLAIHFTIRFLLKHL